MGDDLETLIESVLDRLGMELVDLERAGGRSRPILRLRIDRGGSEPGVGVTVEDCARVSRELEVELDERGDVPASYILEVSSPGVERPLKKRRDFERFAGHVIAVRGYAPIVGGSRRLEGELVSIEGPEGSERIKLRTEKGDEIEIDRSDIARAQLVFRWEES